MPVNRAAVGRSVTGEPFEVLRENLIGFAKALGHTDPIYLDAAAAQAAGRPDVVASPTYAVILTRTTANQMLNDPTLGLDNTNVVHGEQSVSCERPIYAGDVLTSTTTVLDIRDAGLHELVTTRSKLTHADGAVVCSAQNVIVSRGSAASPDQK